MPVRSALLRWGLPLVAVGVIGAWALLKSRPDTPPAAELAADASSFSCGDLNIPLGVDVPGDAPIMSNQTDADCFGWWEFIALNWPTASGGFGDPGDTGPVQWETYMPKDLLFQPGAATPPPWGTQPAVPAHCAAQAGLAAIEGPSLRLLRATSKFTTEFDAPESLEEAAPADGPNWLGAQNGTNVWYEIRVSQDEYNYVVANQFYNANQQGAWVDNGSGQPIVLPKGSSQSGGPVGAAQQIEVPASCLPSGGSSPVTVSCTANTAPPYYLGPGCPAPVPIQVTRTVPLDSTAQQVNPIAQTAITQAYPDSVWQYYQLVNVIWSTSPTQDPGHPLQVPMPLSSMQPLQAVANVALETYAQSLTCTDCHRYATVAPISGTPDPVWDSDFSFALGSASAPASAAAGR